MITEDERSLPLPLPGGHELIVSRRVCTAAAFHMAVQASCCATFLPEPVDIAPPHAFEDYYCPTWKVTLELSSLSDSSFGACRVTWSHS
jgi:hypothetical protein